MKLSEKQQDLFDEIKDLTSNGSRLSIDPHEVPTAKALVRKGLITLDHIKRGDQSLYEATLIDPRRRVIEDIQSFIALLNATCQVLEGETDPKVLLHRMVEIKHNQSIETFRRALRDRALELSFKQNKKPPSKG
jgi:hypothetical protein